MKNIFIKYQLRVGILLALIFPGIFVFADPESSHLLNRFLSSFLFILFLWIVNFSLLDFTGKHLQKTKYPHLKKYTAILFSFLCAILLYLFIGYIVDRTGTLLSRVSGDKSTSFSSWSFLCLQIIFFNALIVLIKYLFDTNAEKRRIELENEVLKRENLNALHETLKQQVNPHFLFNTLNTLKSLVKRDAAQSAEFITELSAVYRYMLLHQDKQIVSLHEEIEFLKSYLYLMKIRFGDAIDTCINIGGELLKSNIPPNTLQLLIENALKHNTLSAKRVLHISVFVKENFLVVENNLQPKAEQNSSSNIGLKNINSRYLLLSGKEIIIDKTKDTFKVLLPILE